MNINPLRCLLTLALLLCGCPAHADQPNTEFARIVAALKTAPPEWRMEFASLALTELADAYLSEADLAQADQQGNLVKKRRWSRAVQRFADQLLLLKMQVEQDQDVSFQLSSATETVVEASGQQAMLSYPRPGQQLAFEQKLLEVFCQQRDCSSLSSTVPASEPKPVATDITPDWAFTEDGLECSFQGLSFRFAFDQASGNLREHCIALFREVGRLTHELSDLQQFGVVIDWQDISIQPTRIAEEQAVQLNASGDTVLLPIPLLQANPKLLPLLLPWLAERLQGKDTTLALTSADFD